jgi:hypothetical protein
MSVDSVAGLRLSCGMCSIHAGVCCMLTAELCWLQSPGLASQSNAAMYLTVAYWLCSSCSGIRAVQARAAAALHLKAAGSRHGEMYIAGVCGRRQCTA